MPSPKRALSDVTFVIPVRIDFAPRLRNVRIVSEWILSRFDTTVVISEYDRDRRLSLDGWPEALRRRIRHRFFCNPHPFFQRARAVNLGVGEVRTPFFAVLDSDVLLGTAQYEDGSRMLREGKCEMSLPYENRVMWIPRDEVTRLQDRLDDRMLASLDYETSDDSYHFVGLVNLFETRAFVQAGMMNEHFRSWGYEDVELYHRFRTLGYRVLRTGGCAYHLGHGNGGDTGPHHPYFLANGCEYRRIVALSPEQLRREVESWPWARGAAARATGLPGEGPNERSVEAGEEGLRVRDASRARPSAPGARGVACSTRGIGGVDGG
jgi:hypothetical protein